MNVTTDAPALPREDQPLRIAHDPALARSDWLPQGTGWAGMDQLRDEHVRLLRARADAGREAAEIRRRHEEEDEQRQKALTAAFAAGRTVEPVEMTPREERRDELAPAEARVQASARALDDFLGSAVETIKEHEPEWLALLNEQDEKVRAVEEEAQRMVEQARANAARVPQMKAWLTRTAGSHPRFESIDGRHVPAPQPVADDSADLLAIANRNVIPQSPVIRGDELSPDHPLYGAQLDVRPRSVIRRKPNTNPKEEAA